MAITASNTFGCFYHRSPRMQSLERLDIDLEHSQLLQEVDEKHNQPPNLARWATIEVVMRFLGINSHLSTSTLPIFHMWTPPEDTVCCSTRPSKVVSFAGHQIEVQSWPSIWDLVIGGTSKNMKRTSGKYIIGSLSFLTNSNSWSKQDVL